MNYDLIVAGAGLGGLSFLHHFLERDSPDWRILLIDQSNKERNDRTWSFWSEDAYGYRSAEASVWSDIGFASDQFEKYQTIAPYHYHTIRGIDFYDEILRKVRQHPNVHFIQDEILSITNQDHEVWVRTARSVYGADYVIDSVTRPKDINAYLCNWQNFLGWELKVPHPAFEPNKPLLMDFRVSQSQAPSFVYLLPYSETEALVEYTQFATYRDYDPRRYAQELRSYIHRVLGLSNYQLTHEEQGAIPMTNYPFKSQVGRIFRIGTVGGDTKPTTGYTFSNVQAHADRILDTLTGVPNIHRDTPRFRFYDSLLLEIIAHRPQWVKPIMTTLFRTQSFYRIMKFLNEDSNFLEEAAIFSRLPWTPFLSVLKDQTYAIFDEDPSTDARPAGELLAR